ncbi:hypothetical protein HOR96_gp52 [Agrobacterium phage Atu_ph02]|uniref:Uncharacterized protein n=1 Tax=Agrobacterium phage Atu_ph02 TaxID=2024261 RepID=A0A2L0UZ27_9CAUD|nr:hypothetical protein HOR96_gp52 [Agrobacterium phage Atu_ph02]AUZ94760.1 hypothetical protein [Agrobacterium phage Atu_ph02]
MHGLETIKRMNAQAQTPTSHGTVEGIIEALSTGDVKTIVWSLFDEQGDFIRQYVTEVHDDAQRKPTMLLRLAIATEGMYPRETVPHAELDLVIDHACIVSYKAEDR